MGAISAGILVYRRLGAEIEFLLGHPGGPFWARKDLGAWMAPKGLIMPGEPPLAAAIREFREETGIEPPPVNHALAPVLQAGGKTVLCWAAEGDLDLTRFSPGEFDMEWPPRSGRRSRFPELDRLAYFGEGEARKKILPSQLPFIAELVALLSRHDAPPQCREADTRAALDHIDTAANGH